MERETYYGITRPDGSHPKSANMFDRCDIALVIRATIEQEIADRASIGVHVTKGDVNTILHFVLHDLGLE